MCSVCGRSTAHSANPNATRTFSHTHECVIIKRPAIREYPGKSDWRNGILWLSGLRRHSNDRQSAAFELAAKVIVGRRGPDGTADERAKALHVATLRTIPWDQTSQPHTSLL